MKILHCFLCIQPVHYAYFFNRIWGEHGQRALEKAKVCLLTAGPTGTETLKNLVLGGMGSFTVVDEKKVEAADLGNNFLGASFFHCLSCRYLQFVERESTGRQL